MKLKTLTLSHFRNFSERAFDLDHPLSFIQGHNGTGKTAILEALVLLFYGRSFRTHQPRHIIQTGQPHCQVTVLAEQSGDSWFMGMQKDLQGETLVKLNKTPLASHLPLARLLPINILHPEMTGLLLSERQSRRQLLDWGLFYVNPEFITLWQRYQRILKQRNAALKQASHARNSNALRVWDEALVEAGDLIHRARETYSQQLIQSFMQLDPAFFSEEDIQLRYTPGWPKELSFKDALRQHHVQDVEMGYTLVGPHRADLVIKSHQLPLKMRLSRGQQKKVIWALKLAQSLTLKDQKISTLTLMDDLAAELDLTYQKKLFEIAQSIPGQLIVTGILLPDYLPEEHCVIQV